MFQHAQMHTRITINGGLNALSAIHHPATFSPRNPLVLQKL